MMSNRINPALAATIVAVFAVFVLGAILFTQCSGGSDRGLMVRQIADGGTCTLSWQQGSLPITVVPPEEATEEWVQALLAAIAEWNTLLGVDAFQAAHVGSVVGVWHNTTNFTPNDEVFRFVARSDGRCNLVDGVWHWPGQIDPSYRRRFLMHGLGHWLGLEHDDVSDSVMNPAPRFMGAAFVVTSADLRLLKSLYAR